VPFHERDGTEAALEVVLHGTGGQHRDLVAGG
jgi:hypothetical protein